MVPGTERAPPLPSSAPRQRRLDFLSVLLATAAVVLCFIGRGRHRDWLILALWLPAMRVVVSAPFRERVRGWVVNRWRELADYSLHGGPTPWRATFGLVVIPAASFYLASGSVPGVANGDTSPVVPTAVRFVTSGDYRLDTHVGDANSSLAIESTDRLPYYVRQTRRGLYSNYPAGMTTFAVPMVAVSHVLGADWQRPAVPGRIEKWTGAWLAASSVGLFLLTCLRLASPGPAAACTVLVSLASSVLSTASQDLSQQGGVVFWTLLLIWVEVRSGGRPSNPEVLLQAIACGCALTCRISAMLIVGSFLLWVLARSPGRAIITGALSAAAYAPWGLFYWRTYHSLLGPSESQTESYAWAAVPGQHLLGVLVSPGRGFLVYHPWLLTLAWLPWAGRTQRSGLRGWRVFLVSACVLHTALVASWGMWWGGYSWGPRLMTEVVPLAALLALDPLAWLWRRTQGRRAVILLGVLGAWMHLAGPYFQGLRWNSVPVDVDTHPERLWDWRDPPFAFPLSVHARQQPAPRTVEHAGHTG